jgi:hypothetical protein
VSNQRHHGGDCLSSTPRRIDLKKIRSIAMAGVLLAAALAAVAVVEAQLPGTGKDRCFQNPATLECGAAWIYTCNCDLPDN